MVNITINPLDKSAQDQASARQSELTKPAGSLGRLEDLSIQLSGIYGSHMYTIQNKMTVVAAGDHGVVEEGVSQFPQDVTAQMVLNFLSGGAAINVLSTKSQSGILVVDAGVKSELPDHDQLKKLKIRAGTNNFAKGAAMTRDEAGQTIENGINLAIDLSQKGIDLLACGEMGIGNTTSASAITSVICKKTPEEVTGTGTGINEESLKLKIKTIKKSIALNSPDPDDGVDVLSKVGGFEIGFLSGLMLGAASQKIPIIVDGFICAAAALIASTIEPLVKGYMIGSHKSVEPGHIISLNHLGLQPLLDLNMRLGEGSGAALAMPIIEASMLCMTQMATFGEAGVSDDS